MLPARTPEVVEPTPRVTRRGDALAALVLPPAETEPGAAVLDDAYEAAQAADVAGGMTRLGAELCALRQRLGPGRWRHYAETTCRRHAMAALAHQGPITSRAFTKPRGYAGDAVMLDLMYELAPLPLDVPMLVADLYRWEFATLAAGSVRARRDLLAAEIDATADASDRPRILSVACGHLREAQRSGAVAEGRVGAYFALDQDTTSLEVVRAEQGAHGVTAVCGSVRGLLTGASRFTDLDLVYTAGLYDYLSDAVAAELTRVLFAALAPGGRLLVANFAPGLAEQGYMEAFMDWHLIYRDELDLGRVADRVPRWDVAAQRLFRGADEQIVYLELTRA
jgi:extracellular factor (EF) 3-hydroxypalmitic acid methyl ester biosynthesis protein